MQAIYDVAAPAKLNLFLHITGRRPDGYHLLQSVFMLIDWYDTLHFERRAHKSISREDLSVQLPGDDLITRAARALQVATGTEYGAHISVHKSIPAQAGMGGGSSDAASTLLALNRLWGCQLSTKQLVQIGIQLGADVPFFLLGRNAWVEGIGEKMQPIELPMGQFVVVKPTEGLETRRIFTDPTLKRDSEPAIIDGFAANAIGDVFKYGRNDLQPVAQNLCPGISEALNWLSKRGLNGRMTGSGSAVFAHLQQGMHLNEADLSADALANTFVDLPASFQVRLCSSLEVHPLLGWAASDGLSVGSVSCQPV
jgi:4-diphosphocytidyl-2-C-methyl-D-erythritol kinase